MSAANVSSWIAAHLTQLVLAVSAAALLFPPLFEWLSPSAISPLLGVVMFGMGMTLKLSDFKPVFMHPLDVLTGVMAQFVVMPSVAWLLCALFNFPAGLALGVILVGCCPGGTASNVICYLAKGDVALSVAMTGVSTLLSPFVTPALVLLLAGKHVDFDLINMILSIMQIVIMPLAAGFIVNRFFSKTSEKIIPFVPSLSTIMIALIIGIVVAHNVQSILESSLIIGAVVILHNVSGYLCGYGIARVLGLDYAKRCAVSIEVGMQNSGLATTLATTYFAMYPIAAVPGALFSVWHNISGSIMANLFRAKSPIPAVQTE